MKLKPNLTVEIIDILGYAAERGMSLEGIHDTFKRSQVPLKDVQKELFCMASKPTSDKSRISLVWTRSDGQIKAYLPKFEPDYNPHIIHIRPYLTDDHQDFNWPYLYFDLLIQAKALGLTSTQMALMCAPHRSSRQIGQYLNANRETNWLKINYLAENYQGTWKVEEILNHHEEEAEVPEQPSLHSNVQPVPQRIVLYRDPIFPAKNVVEIKIVSNIFSGSLVFAQPTDISTLLDAFSADDADMVINTPATVTIITQNGEIIETQIDDNSSSIGLVF